MPKETKIKNPILRGFHADPSILKVGGDYYIATSTFEWFPGVEIWHSKNLINWELISRPLNRVDQLDLMGIGASCGVWAPCLTYNEDEKQFYLVYSIVYSRESNTRIKLGFEGFNYHIIDSYVVTTKDVRKDWSNRTYLNSSGFDQSFFHDDNGKTYLLNLEWVNENGEAGPNGIIIQEYDKDKKKLVGPIKNIWKGTNFGLSEGPHIYKKNGYYYMLCAEGGTRYNHAAILTRSKNVFGPYELDPNYPLITSGHDKTLPLQKAGHASICEDEFGNVWLTCLVSRPYGVQENCPLGRETALLKYKWNKDNWLENSAGKNEPQEYITVPYEGKQIIYQNESFDFKKLKEVPIQFQASRIPMTKDWIKLTKDGLEMVGRHESQSLYKQSLIARRWESQKFEASFDVQFEPDSHLQSAGLVHKYSEAYQYVLKFTRMNNGKKAIKLETWIYGGKSEPIKPIFLDESVNKIYFKTCVNYYDIDLYYSINNKQWHKVGKTLDAATLSDDFIPVWSFTGAFVGMFVVDQQQQKKKALFNNWKYKEVE